MWWLGAPHPISMIIGLDPSEEHANRCIQAIDYECWTSDQPGHAMNFGDPELDGRHPVGLRVEDVHRKLGCRFSAEEAPPTVEGKWDADGNGQQETSDISHGRLTFRIAGPSA